MFRTTPRLHMSRWFPPLSDRSASQHIEYLHSIGERDVADALAQFIEGSAVDRVLYHGTTHDFDAFDTATGATHGHFGGKVVYLTTSPADASENYAGKGPDLTARLGQETESQIAEWDDEGGPSHIEDWGSLPWDAKYQLAMEEVEPRVYGGRDNVMPVFVRLVNPVVLQPRYDSDDDLQEQGGGTWIELEYPDDPELSAQVDRLDDDLNDLLGQLREAEGDRRAELEAMVAAAEERYYEAREELDDWQMSSEPVGPGAALLDAARELGEEYDEANIASPMEELAELVRDGSYAYRIDACLREIFAYCTNVEGELAQGEAVAAVWRKAGFDGIIQDAFYDFGRPRSWGGARMDHLEYGDQHVIVFDPRAIKSATGCRTFDQRSASLTDSDLPMTQAIDERPLVQRKSLAERADAVLRPSQRPRQLA